MIYFIQPVEGGPIKMLSPGLRAGGGLKPVNRCIILGGVGFLPVFGPGAD